MNVRLQLVPRVWAQTPAQDEDSPQTLRSGQQGRVLPPTRVVKQKLDSRHRLKGSEAATSRRQRDKVLC